MYVYISGYCTLSLPLSIWLPLFPKPPSPFFSLALTHFNTCSWLVLAGLAVGAGGRPCCRIFARVTGNTSLLKRYIYFYLCKMKATRSGWQHYKHISAQDTIANDSLFSVLGEISQNGARGIIIGHSHSDRCLNKPAQLNPIWSIPDSYVTNLVHPL